MIFAKGLRISPQFVQINCWYLFKDSYWRKASISFTLLRQGLEQQKLQKIWKNIRTHYKQMFRTDLRDSHWKAIFGHPALYVGFLWSCPFDDPSVAAKPSNINKTVTGLRIRGSGIGSFGLLSLEAHHRKCECAPPWQYEQMLKRNLKVLQAYTAAVYS